MLRRIITGLLLILAICCAWAALAFWLGGAREKARQVMSLRNLKQIGSVIVAYTEAHNEKLPPLTTLDALWAALGERKDGDTLWRVPSWNLPYATNPALSGKVAENPGEQVVVFEPVPLWSGKTRRNVLFVDGHVKSVDARRWDELKAVSGIEEAPPPAIAPWWQPFASGPREPTPDPVKARLWGGGALLFLFLAATLRRRGKLKG